MPTPHALHRLYHLLKTPCTCLILFLLAAAPVASLGQMPSSCMQADLASTTECVGATLLDAKYLAPEYTNRADCPVSSPGLNLPHYGYYNAASEVDAAGRIDANWSCYLVKEFNACAIGGIQPGSGNYWSAASTSWILESEIDTYKGVGILQRSVPRTYTVPLAGICTSSNVSSVTVMRRRPAICDVGWSGPFYENGGYYCQRAKPGRCCQQANPIDLNAGQKVQRETDFAATGGSALEQIRHYNSGYTRNRGEHGPLGRAWHTNFDRRVLVYALSGGRTGSSSRK